MHNNTRVYSTIQELIDEDLVFMGSDWKEDDSIKDGPLPGFRYCGEIPCVNCNDIFWWGCADCENVSEETLEDLNNAIKDCSPCITTGLLLYCARAKKMRPQGAAYSYIPKELWPLFDECGPKRELGIGNPYAPGEYNPCSCCSSGIDKKGVISTPLKVLKKFLAQFKSKISRLP
jgi:hypothetical protein